MIANELIRTHNRWVRKFVANNIMLTKQAYKLFGPARVYPTFRDVQFGGNVLVFLGSPNWRDITIPSIYNFSYLKLNSHVTKVTRRRPKLETVECLDPPK